MTFKPAIWYPVAVVLAVINVGGIWFAARAAEPWHAGTHGVLALLCWWWAQRLRLQRQAALAGVSGDPLALEVDRLRYELDQARQRLELAERALARESLPRDPRD